MRLEHDILRKTHDYHSHPLNSPLGLNLSVALSTPPTCVRIFRRYKSVFGRVNDRLLDAQKVISQTAIDFLVDKDIFIRVPRDYHVYWFALTSWESTIYLLYVRASALVTVCPQRSNDSQ